MAEKSFNIVRGFKYSIAVSMPLLVSLFYLISISPSEFKDTPYFWIGFGFIIIATIVILIIGVGGWLYAILKGIFYSPLHDGCLGRLIYNNNEDNYKCNKCHEIISHPK